MAFHFRLEKLLKHRKTLQDEAQRAYQEAQAHVNKVLENIKGMYNQIDEARHTISELQKLGGRSLSDIAVMGEFIEGQKVRIEREKKVARDLMLVADEKLEELVAAMRELKVIEKLRERKKEYYLKEQKKLDQKRTNELVTMRAKRGI